MPSITLDTQTLSALGAVAVAAAGAFAWVVVQWKKEEELKKKEEQLKVEAERRRATAEHDAWELRNAMPEIVIAHFQKIETYLEENLGSVKARLEKVQAQIRDLSKQLDELKSRSIVKADDCRRLADELTGLEQEVTDVTSYLQLVESKRSAARQILQVLASRELDRELVAAAEAKLNARLRHDAAARTATRVLDRHEAEMTAAAAATVAKFAEMSQRLELVEHRAAAAQKMRAALQLELPRSPQP